MGSGVVTMTPVRLIIPVTMTTTLTSSNHLTWLKFKSFNLVFSKAKFTKIWVNNRFNELVYLILTKMKHEFLIVMPI